jgi:hypothetical protein
MESKQKMAIAGSGLIAAGIGLGIVGTALIVPAVIAWTVRLVEKGVDGFAAKVERRRKLWGQLRALCIDPSPKQKEPAWQRSNVAAPMNGASLARLCLESVWQAYKRHCYTSPIIHPHRSCSHCSGIAMVQTSKTRKRNQSLTGIPDPLGITRITEHQLLEVSVWGSPDGHNWDSRPLAKFPPKFYCGIYSIPLNLSAIRRARLFCSRYRSCGAHDEQLLWNQCSGNLATQTLLLAYDSASFVRLLTGRWAAPIHPGTRTKQAHPVVNSAPQRRRSPVEGESIHVKRSTAGQHVCLLCADRGRSPSRDVPSRRNRPPSRTRHNPYRVRQFGLDPQFSTAIP